MSSREAGRRQVVHNSVPAGVARAGSAADPARFRRKCVVLATLLVVVVGSVFAVRPVARAVTPSTFNDTFQGCPWSGYTRLLGGAAFGKHRPFAAPMPSIS